jgi:hypothetical protein
VTVNVYGLGTHNTLDVSAFIGVTSSLSQMPATVVLTVTDIQTILFDPPPGPVLLLSAIPGTTSAAPPQTVLNPVNGLRNISTSITSTSAHTTTDWSLAATTTDDDSGPRDGENDLSHGIGAIEEHPSKGGIDHKGSHAAGNFQQGRSKTNEKG